ncbi:MFS transporter [Pseudonocardia acidicola]|uniref:MFS transporter n=1 Tax=Pseudonocardia acidicola TaxID=2724939 RepID=A0ABX1SC34_9PSEU|nr:MFS transporter [Pseudonocardia acidicola]NMH98432.1 MFS transporter [Pseudonocardia acidicola]
MGLIGLDPVARSQWTPSRVRRTSVVTVGLLMGIYVIDYIDRVMIAMALPFIGAEFALGKTEQGWLITIFSLVYLVFQIPGGYLADRFGSRRLLLASLLSWSVFTALSGVVRGFVALLVVRALFGIGQALFPGASFKAISERTTPDRRATATGLMLSSNFLGAGLGPLVVAPVLMVFGWRHTFWIVALGGVLIAVLLWTLLPRPLPRRLTVDEADGPDTEAGPAPSGAASLRAVLRTGAVWKFAALFCATNMLSYGMITWIPSYLLEERGISLVQTGVLAAIPFLVMSVCVFLGGWLFDRYFSQRARVFAIPVLAAAAVMLVLMLRAGTTAEFTLYQTLAMGIAGLSFMCVLGMPIRALPTAVVASGMGVVNVGGQLAGVLAPVVMGFLVDRFSYTAAFGFLIVSTVAAALIAIFVPQRPSEFAMATQPGQKEHA